MSGQQARHEHRQWQRDVKDDTIGQHAEPPGTAGILVETSSTGGSASSRGSPCTSACPPRWALCREMPGSPLLRKPHCMSEGCQRREPLERKAPGRDREYDFGCEAPGQQRLATLDQRVVSTINTIVSNTMTVVPHAAHVRPLASSARNSAPDSSARRRRGWLRVARYGRPAGANRAETPRASAQEWHAGPRPGLLLTADVPV